MYIYIYIYICNTHRHMSNMFIFIFIYKYIHHPARQYHLPSYQTMRTAHPKSDQLVFQTSIWHFVGGSLLVAVGCTLLLSIPRSASMSPSRRAGAREGRHILKETVQEPLDTKSNSIVNSTVSCEQCSKYLFIHDCLGFTMQYGLSQSIVGHPLSTNCSDRADDAAFGQGQRCALPKARGQPQP